MQCIFLEDGTFYNNNNYIDEMDEDDDDEDDFYKWPHVSTLYQKFGRYEIRRDDEGTHQTIFVRMKDWRVYVKFLTDKIEEMKLTACQFKALHKQVENINTAISLDDTMEPQNIGGRVYVSVRKHPLTHRSVLYIDIRKPDRAVCIHSITWNKMPWIKINEYILELEKRRADWADHDYETHNEDDNENYDYDDTDSEFYIECYTSRWGRYQRFDECYVSPKGKISTYIKKLVFVRFHAERTGELKLAACQFKALRKQMENINTAISLDVTMEHHNIGNWTYVSVRRFPPEQGELVIHIHYCNEIRPERACIIIHPTLWNKMPWIKIDEYILELEKSIIKPPIKSRTLVKNCTKSLKRLNIK